MLGALEGLETCKGGAADGGGRDHTLDSELLGGKYLSFSEIIA